MGWTLSFEAMTALAAAYASVVSTAALTLEIRRWFESGPRLTLSVISEAETYGGLEQDDRTFLAARITNRGSQATTVTNFALHEFSTFFHRLCRRAKKSAIVPYPELNAHPLPYVLQPGTEWMGATPYNDELSNWAASEKLFVAIYHSHSSRPVLGQVRVKKDS